jgi:serine/threonine-protein kinase
MYMSPEQIRSSKNVDYRSDVWSLGVDLFELLTGRLPFSADHMAGLLASIIADRPVPVRSIAPAVPPVLEQIIFACLEKDPSRRIGSVAELAARLAPFASKAGRAIADEVAAKGGVSSRTISLMPPVRPLESSSPAFASGTTGMDLAETNRLDRAARRRSLVVAFASSFAVLVATSVVGIAVVTSRRGGGAGAATTVEPDHPPTSVASNGAAPMHAVPVLAATQGTPDTSATAPQVAATPSSGRRPSSRPPAPLTTRGVASGQTASTATSVKPSAPAAAPAPAPIPSPNLDSRY